MKLYILSILLFLFLFSCNQKPAVDSQKSNLTEVEKKEVKNTDTEEVKIDDFDSYTNAQLDSFFQVSRDSLLDFVSKNEFDKDTIISNEFSQVVYGVAANGFPAFVLLEDHACHFKDNDECYVLIYTRENETFELKQRIKNSNTFPFVWTPSQIERRDVNFDERLDIIIERSIFSGSREITEYTLITNPNFKKTQTIFTTYSLPTNPKNKTVISFTDGGNYGTNSKHINKWQGDSLVEIRRLDKTYQDENGDILEEFTIKNGKETKVKSQKMSFEEAEKYFENYQ